MTRLVMAAMVVALGASVAAQTQEASIPASALQLNAGELPQAVETDGDFSTSEWLVRRLFAPQYRVIAIQRDGRICLGAWFTPTIDSAPSITVQRVGIVHKLLIREFTSDQLVVVSLDTPKCPTDN